MILDNVIYKELFFPASQLNDKGEAVAVGKLFQEKITANPALWALGWHDILDIFFWEQQSELHPIWKG